MKASIIPYCVAAMLGHAKATGGRVAINYRGHASPTAPLKTLAVEPHMDARVQYLILVVDVKKARGKKSVKRRLACRWIHSITDSDGKVHTFSEDERVLCAPQFNTASTAGFMART